MYDSSTGNSSRTDYALAVCGDNTFGSADLDVTASAAGGSDFNATAGGNSSLALRCALEDPFAVNAILHWPTPRPGGRARLLPCLLTLPLLVLLLLWMRVAARECEAMLR